MLSSAMQIAAKAKDYLPKWQNGNGSLWQNGNDEVTSYLILERVARCKVTKV